MDIEYSSLCIDFANIFQKQDPFDFDKVYKYLDSIKNIHPWILQYFNDYEKIYKAYQQYEDEVSRHLFLSEFILKLNFITLGIPAALISQSVNKYQEQLAWAKNSTDIFWKSKFAKYFNNRFKNEKYRKYGCMFYDIFINEQYKYTSSDIEIRPTEKDTCFDIGACFGETSILFSKIYKAKKVYAFDVLPDNIKILEELIKFNKLEDIIIPLQIGLSNKKGKMGFIDNSINSECNIIWNLDKYTAKYGNKNVRITNVTTIDSFSQERNIVPTFIKCDIEGADLSAIEGGGNTLSSYKPTLALSVYHVADHFYKIPLQVKEFNPDYKLRLKKHSILFETVCYGY